MTSERARPSRPFHRLTLRRRPAAARLAATALALALCCLLPLRALAAERAAMAIDANTGKILYSVAGDAQRYPASLTKMMTLYILFEMIEARRLSYSSAIPISAQAAAQPPSKLGLKVGDEIRALDAIKALVAKSANDVAVAIAERIAGSEAAFARKMTDKARAIGMRNTVFRNASGLPNAEQVTTARDMLTLAMRLQDDFPQHYRLFATRSFSFRGKTYRNHNTLLGSFSGVDGIKTGYIRASGFNLVSSVRRDGKHVVAAVFGGKTAGARNAQMRSLLERSFGKASTNKTRRPILVAEPRRVERPQAARQQPAMARPIEVGRADPPPAARPAGVRPAPNVEIARVRRTEVVPGARADAREPAAAAARPRPLATASAASSAAAVAAPAAAAGQSFSLAPPALEPPALPPPVETVTPRDDDAAPGRPPGTLQSQLAALLARSVLPDSPTSAGTPSAFDAPSPRSAPARARPEPPLALRGPKAEAAGGYLIQVGAFGTRGEAEQRLRSLSVEAGGILAGYQPQTEPVSVGNKTLYRARFAGFDQGTAADVCTELRRRSVDCFVSRPQ